MNHQKEQIAARLGRAKAELEEVLVEIERLPAFETGNVAFAAHALNNFLTVTNASLDLLEMELAGRAEPEVVRLLAGLKHTADLMAHAVSRLMSTSARVEARLVWREADLARLARRASDYYRRIADRKQVEIITELPPSAVVWTDDAAIAAVLDNLLSNAVKYSPPGKRVRVRVAVEPDAVVCDVQDEGPGLSPEDQARLFQKGVRLTPVPTAGEPSTGYGLAVAKEFVTRLGGTLWCESRLGDGACFSFRLPATPRA